MPLRRLLSPVIIRACFQVAELPVAVVRRLQDAFEPAAPRQASEGREVEDYQAGDRGGEYYSCQDSHCASYFVLDISFPTGCTVQRYRFLRNCGYTDYGLGYHNPRNLCRHPEGILEMPRCILSCKGEFRAVLNAG